MSSFIKHREESAVGITEWSTEDGVTYYCIRVCIGACSWTVRRRFRDFVELHDKLAAEHGVPKDKLPPKKIIGNKSSKFIEQRRDALNEYICWTWNHLRLATPPVLTRFLDLHQYDIYFLLQALAEKLFAQGDSLLQSGAPYKCSPLELHAISERLKIPCPPTEKQDQMYDFSHILDFCSQLKNLHVEGSYEPLGSSNIIPNDLSFDFSCFKSLEHLTMLGVPLPRIQSVGTLRDTLESVAVLVAGAVSMNEFLLVDIVHKETEDSVADPMKWRKLKSINFGSNKVECVDWAIRLAPNLQTLALSSNQLNDVSDISSLHHLTTLDLSMNRVSSCAQWHERMGNVRSLDLSQNRLESLAGFSRLYSLESVNLSCNLIAHVEEVRHICRLPCLERLWLSANPVASTIDYRVKVLELFGQRAAEITLDNEKASEKELDTARVLTALRIMRAGAVEEELLGSHNSTHSYHST